MRQIVLLFKNILYPSQEEEFSFLPHQWQAIHYWFSFGNEMRFTVMFHRNLKSKHARGSHFSPLTQDWQYSRKQLLQHSESSREGDVDIPTAGSQWKTTVIRNYILLLRATEILGMFVTANNLVYPFFTVCLVILTESSDFTQKIWA